MSRGTQSKELQIPRDVWVNARRVVVKIGSALLADTHTGALKHDWLVSLLDDIAQLKKDGRDVVLVSSGAVALGRAALGITDDKFQLEHAQASAAVGQIGLAHAYEKLAKERGIVAAQILLTLANTEERRRYLNARQTLETLLGLGALPIVNENNAVATNEIRYGDNDRLSARVASMVSADCLVLLSDIDGLYTAPPADDPTATRLDLVTEITPEIEAMAGDAGTALSTGGMRTKVEAAKVARGAGCHMVIASGKIENPLAAIGNGAPCTWFLAPSDPVTAKKSWISGQLEPKGDITIDDGARRALENGKSLLPAGVIGVTGTFDRGDAVIIRASDGHELGRGLSAYADYDAKRIAGKKSSEIKDILGYEGRNELVHRNHMALNQAQ